MKVSRSRILIILAMLLTLSVSALFFGCEGRNEYEGQTKIIFNLGGGKYKNSERDVVNYYAFKSTDAKKIIPFTEVSGEGVLQRTNYLFKGWYKDRTLNSDGTYSYSESDKWNFDSDRVSGDELTLYARWCMYSYNVCYKDEAGNKVLLGTYYDQQQKRFNDKDNYASERKGYTFTGNFLKSDGSAWDATYFHPGGESDLAVDVYCEYIEGDVAIARDPSSLSEAIRSSKDIYITKDIDFDGAMFSGFGKIANRKIIGNNCKITNFALSYNDLISDLKNDERFGGAGLLIISMFTDVSNAEIKDLTMEMIGVAKQKGSNVLYTKNDRITRIIVTPMFLSVNNVKVTNVSIKSKVEITGLPSGFKAENLTIAKTKDDYCIDGEKEGTNTFDDFTVSVTVDDKT